MARTESAAHEPKRRAARAQRPTRSRAPMDSPRPWRARGQDALWAPTRSERPATSVVVGMLRRPRSGDTVLNGLLVAGPDAPYRKRRLEADLPSRSRADAPPGRATRWTRPGPASTQGQAGCRPRYGASGQQPAALSACSGALGQATRSSTACWLPARTIRTECAALRPTCRAARGPQPHQVADLGGARRFQQPGWASVEGRRAWLSGHQRQPTPCPGPSGLKAE